MSVSISGAGSISGLDQGFNVTTGNVGIGTDDASWGVSTGLMVGDGASAKGITIFSNAANVGDLAFADATSGTARYRGLIRYDHSDNSLALRTNSSERLRITSGGTLQVKGGSLHLDSNPEFALFEDNTNGTYTNSAKIAFDYSGNVARIRSSHNGSGTSRALAFYYQNAESLRIDTNGYVKTNSEFWIGGSASPVLRWRDGSSEYATARISSGDLYFEVAGTEKLRISSDGKVGVGENSPDRLLHLKAASSTAYSGGSDTADYNFLKIENTTDDKSAGVFFLIGSNGEAAITATEVADGATDIAFQNRGGGVRSEKLRISSDGKVCVGTTLTNYGVLQIRDASGDSTTSAIQVENASSGNSTTNVILRSVSLNSGAWANAEYRAKSHVFSYHTTPVLSVLGNFGPWAEGNKGTTRGTLHLRPGTTDHMGGAITFGASDSGSGETAMAGIYTRSDGNYGTKMYFATTDSYNTGPKNAMFIDEHGYIHDSNRPFIYGTPTNTNGSGVANSMSVLSSRNLTFSNSRITVPVSGVYHICFNTICDSGSSRVDAHIRVNGSTRVNSLSEDATAGYHYRGMSISLMLSANDYIQFNNNDWYNSATTSAEYWRTASVVFLG